MKKKIKIFCFSDTHNYHYLMSFKDDIDVAVFAGDAGSYRNPHMNKSGILDFIDWYSSFKNIKTKIWIAGNHCTSIEAGFVDAKALSEEKGLTYLEHEAFEAEGIKFFGSPYTPTFGVGWAYNVDRDELKNTWASIPNDCEFLITHGPPANTKLDRCNDGSRVGCKHLMDKILDTESIVCNIFGHIHEGYGIDVWEVGEGDDARKVTLINASVLNASYQMRHKPVLIEVDENKKVTILDEGYLDLDDE